MSDPKYTLGPMRLPFLVLTPACVVVGAGTAYYTTGELNFLYLVLALIGAITSHISVNAFNEFFDFKSGLDSNTERTPFSGGSGVLPKNPEMANRALGTAVIALTITLIVGIYFIFVWGTAILPLGLLGLFIIVAYTPLLTRQPLLCLIAPGLGFGPFMVMGTHFVLTGEYSWMSFLASLVPFFLVGDLLLLNQFPDVQADKAVGRKHFPITLGRKKSSLIYSLFLFLTFATIIYGVYNNSFPVISLMALATIVFAIPLSIGTYKNADNIEKLIPFMGKNVIINILTPLLLAISFFVG